MLHSTSPERLAGEKQSSSLTVVVVTVVDVPLVAAAAFRLVVGRHDDVTLDHCFLSKKSDTVNDGTNCNLPFPEIS